MRTRRGRPDGSRRPASSSALAPFSATGSPGPRSSTWEPERGSRLGHWRELGLPVSWRSSRTQAQWSARAPSHASVQGVLAVLRVAGHGERLPLREGSVDVVYARQVLHHASDLPGLLKECARVLRPGGVLLAAREHVVDDATQLAEFLRNHPVHRLAGGENAFSLPYYLAAVAGAGLHVRAVLGPWDSVINAFPAVNSDEELSTYAPKAYVARHGILGRIALRFPGAARRVRRALDQPIPGRMYSFLCERPPHQP